MTNMIILDNIFNDFDCNKEFMYSILTKYTKNQELTKLEYYAVESLLIQVIKYIQSKITEPYYQVAVKRLLNILKELNTPKRNCYA